MVRQITSNIPLLVLVWQVRCYPCRWRHWCNLGMGNAILTYGERGACGKKVGNHCGRVLDLV